MQPHMTHCMILNKNEQPLDVGWNKGPGVAPYSIYTQHMSQIKRNTERIETKQDKQDNYPINPR